MSRYSTRPRDFAYLAWITTQQCCVCESQHALQLGRTYAHHAGPRAFARKSPDRSAIPLCWKHHDRGSSISIHTLGKKFWVVYRMDRIAIIAELQERYNLETGRLAA